MPAEQPAADLSMDATSDETGSTSSQSEEMNCSDDKLYGIQLAEGSSMYVRVDPHTGTLRISSLQEVAGWLLLFVLFVCWLSCSSSQINLIKQTNKQTEESVTGKPSSGQSLLMEMEETKQQTTPQKQNKGFKRRASTSTSSTSSSSTSPRKLKSNYGPVRKRSQTRRFVKDDPSFTHVCTENGCERRFKSVGVFLLFQRRNCENQNKQN